MVTTYPILDKSAIIHKDDWPIIGRGEVFMQELQLGPDALLDVRVRLGRERLYAASPARVQVLVETRPSVRTRATHEPVEMRLVIDVSGSMAESGDQEGISKLALVKRAVLELLHKLEGQDRVLVSVFSTSGHLLVPSTLLGESGAYQRIVARIAGLLPQYSTDISSGLSLTLADPPRDDALPRVILFTDGESSNPEIDHRKLRNLADRARSRDISLSIYGTGTSYNWSLLRQLAARAGGGSFCKHVLSAAELEGHLLGELAVLRGTAVDRLMLEGAAAEGAQVVGVFATMPVIKELAVSDDRHFEDHAGALDVHRAAIHLIEVEIEHPRVGDVPVLELQFRGRRRSTMQAFTVSLPVSQTFVECRSDESPVDEEVRRVMLAILADKKAQQDNWNAAEDLYRRAGDTRMADSMATMQERSMNPGADFEAHRRTAATQTSSSMTGDVFRGSVRITPQGSK